MMGSIVNCCFLLILSFPPFLMFLVLLGFYVYVFVVRSCGSDRSFGHEIMLLVCNLICTCTFLEFLYANFGFFEPKCNRCWVIMFRISPGILLICSSIVCCMIE